MRNGRANQTNTALSLFQIPDRPALWHQPRSGERSRTTKQRSREATLIEHSRLSSLSGSELRFNDRYEKHSAPLHIPDIKLGFPSSPKSASRLVVPLRTMGPDVGLRCYTAQHRLTLGRRSCECRFGPPSNLPLRRFGYPTAANRAGGMAADKVAAVAVDHRDRVGTGSERSAYFQPCRTKKKQYR